MNNKVAIDSDIIVIPKMGKKMAEIITTTILFKIIKFFKKEIPLWFVIFSLKKTHWFQEDIEIIKINNSAYILQAVNCQFQIPWIKKYGQPLKCVNSHLPFLRAFCEQLNPNVKITHFFTPQNSRHHVNNIYCCWQLRL